MKYEVKFSRRFKKSFKKFDRKIQDDILSMLELLANDVSLEAKYKDHKLIGDYKDCRECHIKPDLLLIYKKENKNLILICLAIGSHADLF